MENKMAASTQADLLGNRYGHLAYRRRVIVPSSASTANYNVSPTESGAIFRVANIAAVTRKQFSLPRVSSLGLGLTYDFLLAKPTSAQDIAIASTIDSSAQIVGVAGTTASTVSTASALAPGSTIGAFWYAKFTAVSSINWVAETYTRPESSGDDLIGALVYGDWVPGTTVA